MAIIPDTGFVLATFSRSGSGLVLLDEYGVQRNFIPTGFNPAHLAIAEDHSIWVAGSSGRKSTDHMLVHKYSPSGAQIGAYLPFSSFAAGTVEPLMTGPDTTILVGGGVVVVTARSGAGSNTNARMRELIRMDESGQILTRTPLDRPTEQMFITSDGVLYSSQNNGAVYRYSPATQSWDHMTRPTTRHWLFGTDGSDLVYRTDDPGKVLMTWYPQPSGN
jgi:streptogramin lyase